MNNQVQSNGIKHVFSMHDVMSFVYGTLNTWCDEGEITMDGVRTAVEDMFVQWLYGSDADIFLPDPLDDLLDGQPVDANCRSFLKAKCDEFFSIKIANTIGMLDRNMGIPNFNWISPVDLELQQFVDTENVQYQEMQQQQFDKHPSYIGR